MWSVQVGSTAPRPPSEPALPHDPHRRSSRSKPDGLQNTEALWKGGFKLDSRRRAARGPSVFRVGACLACVEVVSAAQAHAQVRCRRIRCGVRPRGDRDAPPRSIGARPGAGSYPLWGDTGIPGMQGGVRPGPSPRNGGVAAATQRSVPLNSSEQCVTYTRPSLRSICPASVSSGPFHQWGWRVDLAWSSATPRGQLRASGEWRSCQQHVRGRCHHRRRIRHHTRPHGLALGLRGES